MMFPNLSTRLTKKTLAYMVIGLFCIVVVMALAGCATPNPSWGGARG